MKKIFGLIVLSSFAFGDPVSAQGCNGVYAEVIPQNPQTGEHNYFGVRVTLSYTYYQTVTVNGYIYDDGNPNQNNPFNLTIPAGELSAETGTDFYETSPAENAAVEISSVSPCPFNFNISYDSIGIFHT